MISILCPTRNRVAEFRSMVDSAFCLARHRPEVVAYVDLDDPARARYEKMPDVKLVTGPRLTHTQLWNECLKLATGSIYMQGNDDVIFRTPGWDEMVEQAFAECSDKILMVHGSDIGYHFEKFGPHPFVHRRWVEALGYFTPPYFSSDHGDTWINDLANALKRRRYLPFVVEHLHFLFGKAGKDQTTLDRLARHKKDDPGGLYAKMAGRRQQDVAKLESRMTAPRWSILVLTQPQRAHFLARLLEVLRPQVNARHGVELLVRQGDHNRLLGDNYEAMRQAAKGQYISFIDDDDLVPADYVARILPLLDGVDYVGFQMQQSVDGELLPPTPHSLRYKGYSEDYGVYHRDISHVNPMQRDLALGIPTDSRPGWDVYWAAAMRARGVLKREHYLDAVMYLYQKHTWNQKGMEALVETPKTTAVELPELGVGYANPRAVPREPKDSIAPREAPTQRKVRACPLCGSSATVICANGWKCNQCGEQFNATHPVRVMANAERA